MRRIINSNMVQYIKIFLAAILIAIIYLVPYGSLDYFSETMYFYFSSITNSYWMTIYAITFINLLIYKKEQIANYLCLFAPVFYYIFTNSPVNLIRHPNGDWKDCYTLLSGFQWLMVVTCTLAILTGIEMIVKAHTKKQ